LAAKGPMIMLAGEPGVGKTRIAQELADLSEQRGFRALWDWCYERHGAPPFWPWLQAIRSYVEETHAERLREEMGSRAANIAEILPELRSKLEEREGHPTLVPCWQPAKVGHSRKGEIRGKWRCYGTPGAGGCSVCVGLRSELPPPFW